MNTNMKIEDIFYSSHKFLLNVPHVFSHKSMSMHVNLLTHARINKCQTISGEKNKTYPVL